MTEAEILALVQAAAAAAPLFKAAYNKIRANSNGAIRPLAEVFADTDAMIVDGEAIADKETSGK